MSQRLLVLFKYSFSTVMKHKLVLSLKLTLQPNVSNLTGDLPTEQIYNIVIHTDRHTDTDTHTDTHTHTHIHTHTHTHTHTHIYTHTHTHRGTGK